MKLLRMGWVLVSLFASGFVLADPPHDKGGGKDKHQDKQYDKGRDQGYDRDHDQGYSGGSDVVLSFSFGGNERIYVQDYYRHNLPPGLAKQGKVPPGHAKRMARGMGWPPGVAYEPLPLSLQRRLNPLPRGYARFIVGEDVVIVDMDSRLIVDVVNLLF
jgi:hypothetical protein